MAEGQPLRIEVLDKNVDVPILVKERDSSTFRPVPVELTRSAPLQDFTKDEFGFPKVPTQIQQDAIRNLPVEDVIERPKNTVSGYGGSNLKSRNPIEQIVENVQGFNREVEERKAHRNAVRDAGLSTEDFDRAEAGLSPRGSTGATGARQGAGLAFGIYNATQNPVNHVVPGFVDGLVGVERQHTLIGNPAFNKDARETFRGAYEVGEALRNTIGSGFNEINYAIRGTQDDLRDIWNNRPDFGLPDIPIPNIHIDLPQLDDKKPVSRDFDYQEPEPLIKPYEPPKKEPRQPDVRDWTPPQECNWRATYCRARSITFSSPNGEYTRGEWEQNTSHVQFKNYVTDRYGDALPIELDGEVILNIVSGNEQIGTLTTWFRIDERFEGTNVVRKGYEIELYAVFCRPGESIADAERRVSITWDIKPYGLAGKCLTCHIDSYPPTIPKDLDKQPPEPPPDPKKTKKRTKDDDDMGCCSCYEIYRLMQYTVDSLQFTVKIPVVSCTKNSNEEWEPAVEYKDLRVFANSPDTAYAVAVPHIQLAELMIGECEARNKQTDAVLAIPLSWQIRPEGNRPQMVILSGVYKNGKIGSAKYPINVPHWKGTANSKPVLPAYKKGNWEGIYTLKDNSKVTIHGASEAECLRILNALKPWIIKSYQVGALWKCGKINSDIREQLVKPAYGHYFATGQKKNAPDWVVRF